MEMNVFWDAAEGGICELFDRLTDAQAEEFFDEYVGLQDQRISLLKQRFAETGGGDLAVLDFSPESLLPLWKWGLRHLEMRRYSPEELDRILAMPDYFREDNLRRRPLTRESLILLNDIAYYFAQVFIEQYPQVSWKVCRTNVERYIHNNQPVLAGFDPPMNPRGAVLAAAFSCLHDVRRDDQLFAVYEKAARNLVN